MASMYQSPDGASAIQTALSLGKRQSAAHLDKAGPSSKALYVAADTLAAAADVACTPAAASLQLHHDPYSTCSTSHEQVGGRFLYIEKL